jgi:hypothetical protein
VLIAEEVLGKERRLCWIRSELVVVCNASPAGMPPKGTRAPLRVQNPDNNSASSDEQSDSGARFYSHRGTNGLRVHVPLSPSSTGNNTLQGLVIQTPVSTTPSPSSNSLPSHSYMLDSRSLHYGGLHERRPSDSQRPFPVCHSSFLYPLVRTQAKTPTGADRISSRALLQTISV